MSTSHFAGYHLHTHLSGRKAKNVKRYLATIDAGFCHHIPFVLDKADHDVGQQLSETESMFYDLTRIPTHSCYTNEVPKDLECPLCFHVLWVPMRYVQTLMSCRHDYMLLSTVINAGTRSVLDV